MNTEPIKLIRARIIRAALADIPARVRGWWQLQRDRAYEPFNFADWPESDEPALSMAAADKELR